MGLPFLWGALQWCVLLGCVLGPLGSPLPTVLFMLQRVFPASCRTLRFGTCILGPCGWLLCDCMCTVAGTHHGTGGRQHLGGLLAGLHLLLFLRLVPALASHCITGGACCIVVNLPRAHRLHFQSLAMLEVGGHLLPRQSHFVQTLPWLYAAS